ncbi:NDUFAF6 (predicted) [Pycnogonum litorale]
MNTRFTDNFEVCQETVRKYDHENFLCTLLLPEHVRSAAIVIRAFNVEIAQISDMVTKQELGLARVAFWKEFLDHVEKDQFMLKTPITSELFRMIKKHNLSRHWLKKMVESRESYLGDRPFVTSDDLEDYAERSVSSIYYLILQSAGVNSIDCDHVASHIGKAQGITNLIRGIPYNVSNNRVCIPLDILIDNNVSQEDVLRGQEGKALENVTFTLASAAHQHIQKARSLQAGVSQTARLCFLPAVATSSYLTRLQKANFNVFCPKLQLRNTYLPLSLFWHKLRNKI